MSMPPPHRSLTVSLPIATEQAGDLDKSDHQFGGGPVNDLAHPDTYTLVGREQVVLRKGHVHDELRARI